MSCHLYSSQSCSLVDEQHLYITFNSLEHCDLYTLSAVSRPSRRLSEWTPPGLSSESSTHQLTASARATLLSFRCYTQHSKLYLELVHHLWHLSFGLRRRPRDPSTSVVYARHFSTTYMRANLEANGSCVSRIRTQCV